MHPYQHDDAIQTRHGAARKSGVYGLFRLDGGPIDPRDARALGLTCPALPVDALYEAVDSWKPGACAWIDEAKIVTVVAGVVEQRAALARELGLSADACQARVAQAALARFGADTPARLAGEWSLLQWDRSGGAARLTIMGSAARRDPVLYAQSGSRIAIAPDLFALGRIGWVGSELDESGLLMALGRTGLRSAAGERTMYRAVSRLGTGSGLTFSAEQIPGRLRCDVLALPPRWTGPAEEALAEAEGLLVAIMQERLSRADKAAILLSGGLDSSLLAWAAATGNGHANTLLAFTSAMPPGSLVPDEMPQAVRVAQTLDLPHHSIVPGDELDSFRPSPAILAGANGPPMANRHCLTEAFQQAARTHGARSLINGTYGEATLTARLPQGGIRARLRHLAKRALGRGGSPAWPVAAVDAFHVRLAPDRLGQLPAELGEILRQAPLQPQPVDGQGLLGFSPVVAKSLFHANEFYAGAVRMEFPFRDLRLLRHFAGLPIETARALGPDRGPARQILTGRLPDAIVQRRRGMPADPDHHARLQRQAPAARDRIAAFRKSGLDAWLDLDWLDAGLASIAGQGVRSVDQANLVQLTAVAAEFLLWWQEGGAGTSSRD